MSLVLLEDGPEAGPRLVLAHGAGAGMRHPFLEGFAGGLARRGFRVVRFEFPYRRAGRSRPDPEKVLLDTWRQVADLLGGGRSLFLGGKSLGGRMASMVADELEARALVCLGYPFHPPGQPRRLRLSHLEDLRTPTLILQGTRDPFGSRAEVEAYRLSPAIRVHWLEDGDHSLVPRRSSGRSQAQNLDEAVEAAAAFLEGVSREGRR
ncbi:MAG TPA: alpha/beta fold hydrolase [Candidatus Nitrosotenuis sp.]|nr:alpha/beta fold hydrolase [Candidatus Nitrosotenuis sp.]